MPHFRLLLSKLYSCKVGLLNKSTSMNGYGKNNDTEPKSRGSGFDSYARPSLLGKHTAEDVHMGVRVGIEERESHEQDKDHGTRKGEWHMVAKKATTPVADLEPLFPHAHLELLKRLKNWGGPGLNS
jgi:hypothetical protein